MSYYSTTYKYALALRLYRDWHENENAAKYNNYFHTPEEALSYIDDVLEVITESKMPLLVTLTTASNQFHY